MKIFVDTCVWRYWLTHKNSKIFQNEVFENHARVFDKVYQIISAEPLKYGFLYTDRIEGELPDNYLNDLPMSFNRIKNNRYFTKIPVPLSRADGTYRADGSILCGGSFGGALRGILSMDGYHHETALQNADPDYKLENPVHTKPRKKEFDVEYLESALEANADLFITADQPLIDRLCRALKIFPGNIGDVGEKLKCLCDQDKFCQSFTNVPQTSPNPSRDPTLPIL